MSEFESDVDSGCSEDEDAEGAGDVIVSDSGDVKVDVSSFIEFRKSDCGTGTKNAKCCSGCSCSSVFSDSISGSWSTGCERVI